MCRIPIDCCFWSSWFFLQNFRQIGLFPFPVLILLILMTIWLYVWYVCKSVKPAGFHCVLWWYIICFSNAFQLSSKSPEYEWFFQLGFFLQDVFGPMPTDWLFPDRSRLAKVVESWVKEGGGVAALRRSPPRSAAGRRRLPRRRRGGSSRTEKRRGARRRPRTMYVRTSHTERVGACLPLLAGASCCLLRRAAPSAPGCCEPVSHGSTLCCRPALALMVRLSLAPAAAACGWRCACCHADRLQRES